jgi:hypothetical protein
MPMLDGRVFLLSAESCPSMKECDGDVSPDVAGWMLGELCNNIRILGHPESGRLLKVAYETAIIQESRSILYGEGWKLSWM